MRDCSVVRCRELGNDTKMSNNEDSRRLDVNEMRMLRWVCIMTRRDDILDPKRTHQRDNKSGASVQEKCRQTTEVVRACGEDERGHTENNARCGYMLRKIRRGRPNRRWKNGCRPLR